MYDANLHPVPEDPEVFVLDGSEDREPKETEEFNSITFQLADVGDIMFVSNDHPIPEGWRVIDGEPLATHEWPDYAQAMKITTPFFRVPSVKSPDGHRFVIKLGEHVPAPEADEIPGVGFGLDLVAKSLGE